MILIRLPFVGLFLALAAAQDCTSDGLRDKHERCRVWKDEGECYKNEVY
jgi:hypothetical protein